MADFDKWLTGLPADATVADAARVAIASRTGEVVERLPQAAAGVDQDIVHVHQLRVGCRRSAAVLKVFKKVLPETPADKLGWSVRIVRRAAGPARDLDVFLERLAKEEQQLPGLQGRLYAEREAAQVAIEQANEKLDGGQRVARQAEKLVAKLPADHRKAEKVGARPFVEWARERLEREAERLAAAIPTPGDPVEQLHEFRIAAKRLRYALEVLAGTLPVEERTAAYKQLKKLQKRLGAINDHCTSIDRLRPILPDCLAAERDQIAALIAREETALQEKIDAFWEWWAPSRVEGLMGALRGPSPAAEAEGV